MPHQQADIVTVCPTVFTGPALLAPQQFLAPQQDVGPSRSRPEDDTGLNKLSKRLWTMEIHRRLEIQARRAL